MFASVATIVRVKYFPNYAKSIDYLYGVAPIVWWSTIEIGLGIIAACLSALRPLLRFALGNSSYGPSDDKPSPPTIGTPNRKGYMKARAIKLRNIEDGLASTMITGAGNDTVDNYNESINASDGDKSSQRGILQHIPEHPEPKCTGKEVGILITQTYKIEDDGTEDNISKDRGDKYNGNNESRERTIQDIV